MNLKFIIDENLSPQVAELFRSRGLIAHHVNEMKAHEKHRVSDDRIRRFLLNKPEYVIVTKDDDFVKSFVDRKVPEKMIYVFQLEKKEDLLNRLSSCIPELKSLLLAHDFVEINAKEMKTLFD